MSHAPKHRQSSRSPWRTRLPAVQEAAIGPVPKEIQHHLARTPCLFRHGQTQSEIGPDVLPLAERHLQLGDHVPLGARATFEVTLACELDHRRPGAAVTLLLTYTLADGGPQEGGA